MRFWIPSLLALAGVSGACRPEPRTVEETTNLETEFLSRLDILGRAVLDGGAPIEALTLWSQEFAASVSGDPIFADVDSFAGLDASYVVTESPSLTAELVVTHMPPEAETPLQFNFRCKGPSLFGGLEHVPARAVAQEVESTFGVTEDGELLWVVFLFESSYAPDEREALALSKRGEVVTGGAVRYRPGGPLEWQPLTLQVSLTRAQSSVGRTVGEARPVGEVPHRTTAALEQFASALVAFDVAG